jgi:succinate dehydrogenase / fumarate reductase cytochrome b subunit
MGANWYAVVGALLLAAGFTVHIIYALLLTVSNRKARGNNRYAISVNPKNVAWESQNMFVVGLIVALGLFLHLMQFWYKMQFAEVMGNHQSHLGNQTISVTMGAEFIKYYFSNIFVVVVYLVWFAALWFHISHGFWSALQSIGWNNEIWLPRLKCAAKIFATFICLGFAAVAVVFYIKSLCGAC